MNRREERSGDETTSAAFVPFARDAIEQSIAERFEQQVRRRPAQVAVRDGREELSYAELNRRANQIAWTILAADGDRRAPVAVLLEQGGLLIAAIVGILKAGRPYVGLDPAQPATGLQRTLTHCGADLILTNGRSRAVAEAVAASGQRLLAVDALEASMASHDPVLARSPDDPAYIYYTSGSTGVPKGVLDVQRNVLHNVMRYTNNLRISADDRLTLLQSVAFSGAVSSLFCALLNGATSHVIDFRAEGVLGLANRIEREAITIYHSVPSIFRQLVGTGRRFPSLRLIRLEGDQATRHDVELFQAHFGRGVTLVNGLGATETGISHQFPVTAETVLKGGVVPVGFPTADMAAVILDPAEQPLPTGEIGEIAIRSRFIACGYWRQPELTASRFLPDPAGSAERLYRTGDLGRLGPDGCLEHLGRSEGTLRHNGRWVDGAAIAAALMRVREVREAVVVVRETGVGRTELVAYVVPAAEPPPTVSALRGALRANETMEAIPSRFVFLPELPLDANGKVRRGALPAPGSDRPALATPYVEPVSEVEKTLAQIWREVLQIEPVGVQDDFGELGGDSLQAVELAARIERQFARPVPASLLLEAPCIAAMARRLGSTAPTADDLVIPLAPASGRRPLFLVHDGGGDVLGYGELARSLASEWDVYGLRARGLDGRGAPLDQVEAMAGLYVQAIRRVQQQGAFVLGGNCFGGVVAFEMARQLRAAGERVGRLILIDTAFPVGRLRSRWRHHRRWLGRRSGRAKVMYLLALAGRITGRTGRVMWHFLRRSLGRPAEQASPEAAIIAANRRAEWNYRARLCDAQAVLVFAGRPHNQLHWRTVLRDEPRTIGLPDDVRDRHLIQPPNVGALASALRAELRQAGAEATALSDRGESSAPVANERRS